MKQSIAVINLFILTIFNLSAQSDTTFTYLNKYEAICNKESGVFVSIFYKEDAIWHRENYEISTNYLVAETTYEDDKDGNLFVVEKKMYGDSGVLYRRDIYRRGIITNAFYYYPNGRIQGTALFDTLGVMIKQSGYNENGYLIKDYSFYKEAIFKNSKDSWRVFVFRNFKTGSIENNNAPVGGYSVRINFWIDKNGTISDVNTESNPGFGGKEEAIRVFKLGINQWHPTIENNKPVNSRQSVIISYKIGSYL